jgi:hypothetical protein
MLSPARCPPVRRCQELAKNDLWRLFVDESYVIGLITLAPGPTPAQAKTSSSCRPKNVSTASAYSRRPQSKPSIGIRSSLP